MAPRQPRVALVVKRTKYEVYVVERRDPRLRELLKAQDETVARIRRAHDAHMRTLERVHRALEDEGARVRVTLGAGQRFRASGFDLVVTVGGDGTLLRASRNVVDVPVLAINSAPNHSVGFFCGARADQVASAIHGALTGSLRQAVLTRMQVRVGRELVAERVLNDALFCHTSPAATSRYLVRLGRIREEQKSSGFWVGPAAGSTAAQRSAGGKVLPLSSRALQLVVREPYTPHGERYELRRALVEPGQKLIVRSKMHDARLFIDGPDRVVKTSFGDVIEFSEAKEPLVVLGISARRKWGGHREAL